MIVFSVMISEKKHYFCLRLCNICTSNAAGPSSMLILISVISMSLNLYGVSILSFDKFLIN